MNEASRERNRRQEGDTTELEKSESLKRKAPTFKKESRQLKHSKVNESYSTEFQNLLNDDSNQSMSSNYEQIQDLNNVSLIQDLNDVSLIQEFEENQQNDDVTKGLCEEFPKAKTNVLTSKR